MCKAPHTSGKLQQHVLQFCSATMWIDSFDGWRYLSVVGHCCRGLEMKTDPFYRLLLAQQTLLISSFSSSAEWTHIGSTLIRVCRWSAGLLLHAWKLDICLEAQLMELRSIAAATPTVVLNDLSMNKILQGVSASRLPVPCSGRWCQ